MSTTLMSFLSGGALADVSAGLIKLDEGDLPGAATDFANAFDAGDAEGAFYLGRLFELGLGTDKMRSKPRIFIQRQLTQDRLRRSFDWV